MPLETAERLGEAISARVISPADALAELPAVELTAAGLKRAEHGNWLGPEHLVRASALVADPRKVRLIGEEGRLVGIAESRRGSLHPVVVLG